MATLPGANVTVTATAGAGSSGTDLVCVWSPCSVNADYVPRQFGSAAAVYAQHGYCEGVEYVALHAERTRKPFLFIGLPIAVAGTVGRLNASGNTGTSVVTLTAGSAGVLGEHDGILRVKTGGTIGSSQILLELSLDNGKLFKTVRLGTASSFALPYVNVTASFAAGTLVAGDVIMTWHGSAPRSNSDGWALARAALKAQQKQFRTTLLVGDLQSDTEATSLVAQINGYQTADKRFGLIRASVFDRFPQATLSQSVVRMTGAPTLTFSAAENTVTRSAGSWVADGFVTGDSVTVTLSSDNNVTRMVEVTSPTVLTFGGAALTGEIVSGCVVVGSPTISFNEVGGTADTMVRNRGSWLADGFRVGDLPVVTGTASNNVTAAAGITAVTDTTITFASTDLVDEDIAASSVTVTAGLTKAAWMAALDAEFAQVDDQPRIDLSAGRGRVLSPFSGWNFRRPTAWFASCREYQHDLHTCTWRKSDGPVGADLYDNDNNLVEWDDRVDGEAGTAARFTVLTSWSNGPVGAFIAQSLTRAVDGSILQPTHNMVVVNLACTTAQLATENAVGRSLILNDDGTATQDSLSTIQTEVNAALELALLQNAKGEGPRASKAVWVAATDDIMNVAESVLNGTLTLNLNGTIHTINTSVRVSAAGQV